MEAGQPAEGFRVPMTREICDKCFAPFMRSLGGQATRCCSCALGFKPGKCPSWQALGQMEGRNSPDSLPVKAVCKTCGMEHRGKHESCYQCRERERHRGRYREQKKSLDTRKKRV